ncbi:MAG: hypothetical protein ACXU7D_03910 [Burkholderiaceae bacterium]
MQSTLMIKDLALDKALDGKTMSAVRGGEGNQANGTSQSNVMALFAPVNVGNGSVIGGGPVNFQVDSNPTQTASNYSTSSNDNGLSWFAPYAIPV